MSRAIRSVMDYIRRETGLPAKKGKTVHYYDNKGVKHFGYICGSANTTELSIRFSDLKRSVPMDPRLLKYNMVDEYAAGECQELEVRGPYYASDHTTAYCPYHPQEHKDQMGDTPKPDPVYDGKINPNTIRSRKWREKRKHMVAKHILLSKHAAEKLERMKKRAYLSSDREVIEKLINLFDEDSLREEII